MELNNSLTLGDLGEFRLLNEIILPKLKDVSVSTPLGDDCAFAELSASNECLAITTDIAPRPLVWEIGYKSYYTWGWYSVIAITSDLASTGAEPVAFTTSIEAPSFMLVSDIEDFFSGIHDACMEFGIPNAGGNINEGPFFSCHGTAIGTVPAQQKLTRSGMKPRDNIYVVGESGYFISSYIKARKLGLHSLTNRESNQLLKPHPLVSEMKILREANVLSAASDNSDGIVGALWNLAERSKVGIELNLQESMLSEIVLWAASTERLDPWNLFFFWGDWQQVVAVKEKSTAMFETLALKHNITYKYLGSALDSPPSLYGLINGSRKKLNLIRNENFRPYSYSNVAEFSLDYMLKTPLFIKETNY